MMDYTSQFFIFGILIGLFSIIPTILYFLGMKNSSNKLNNLNMMTNYPKITIFLPVRNESKLIKQKLNEILNLEYPKSKISILIIDSKSQDNTVKIANDFLNNYSGKIPWKIIQNQPKGKSNAVNKALEIIDTDIFVMMDTEPILQSNCLKNLVRWFNDSEIGGVCGKIKIHNDDPGYSYRNRFNILRVGESHIDSTPLFEGSICAFRMSAISKSRINANINADDSQLAMLIRRNGFRAIMDPEIEFLEPVEDIKFFSFKRKTRRAQGITRSLFLNRDLVFNKSTYSKIFLFNFYFYIIMPWFIIISILLVLNSVISFHVNYGNNFYLYSLYSFILIFTILSPIIRGFLNGIFILLYSQIILLFGIKLNVWDQDEGLRQLALELRN
jgi:poly-beta-1,6-N-acetyl-D-glucosamine synthase